MNEKYIGVIAHNAMKPVLAEFLKAKEDWLWGKQLLATGLTADFVDQGNIKVEVKHLNPGKEGGYSQLQEHVDKGQIEMVLFFRDPEIEQDYENEIVSFVKACNRMNIPLATNPASAELLILGMIKQESAQRVRNRSSVDS
ncbi:MAG: methylglyoxal synthase [Flavobacteriales bacterium]|jgi:methylglyoxal synthase